MRQFTFKKWIAAILMLLVPCVANTAGLGRLTVLSALGQPFIGEIELVNVQREELATLAARLAPASAYQGANLQFNPALSGMRLSIERRTGGQSYIKIVSNRPVSEPFIDLLVELTWQGGKIVREYSALLDPPGVDTPAPSVSPPVAAAPAPAVQPPVATPAPARAAAPAAVAPAPAAPATGATKPITGSEYAVKTGDTLGAIAAATRPEGVSLDQMMIALLRANPDAFINNNINLVRAGKILRVPDRDQAAAVAQGEATQEVRVHATNWNAYRQKVADNVSATADSTPATSGKITARVDDKAASPGSKDVVVLSKGDTAAAGKGKDGKAAASDRVRALEEDLAARDKALADAKERVAQLEKTVNEMKKLAELKNPSLAAAQQAGKGDAKGEAPKPDAKAAAKVDAPKAEPPKSDKAETTPPVAAVDTKEAPKADAAKTDAPPTTDKPEEKASAVEPPKEEKAAEAPKPKPKPVAPPPPPPPEPSLMDKVMENIVPIGGGLAAVLLGAGALVAMRRRKKGDVAEGELLEPSTNYQSESFTGNVAQVAADAEPVQTASASVEVPASVSDAVDPIEEAQVYIDHGRDEQAEEILKEAISKNPQREDVQIKLLELYASRGDKNAFNKIADGYQQLTGGAGDNWMRVAAMGYALDPSNALYAGAAGTDVDITAGSNEPSTATVDVDLGGSGADSLGTTTDILLEPSEDAELERTMIMSRDDLRAAAQPEASTALPEFNLDLPPASEAAPAPAADPNAALDFNIEVPPASTPAAEPAPAPAAKTDDGGLDFKVDFSGIDLKLDDTAPAAAGSAKDDQWNDVQQKFDLARAYQEMGDKDGAKEILREVVREGDAQQKDEAKKLLESIK